MILPAYDKENLSEEEYLKRHLSDLEAGKNNFGTDTPFDAEPVTESSRVNDLQYFNFDIKDLPCGRFYPVGTLLMVRPAQVKDAVAPVATSTQAE
jgi:ATP-dependent RNA circularization protein (DNA/RNA ligase family)